MLKWSIRLLATPVMVNSAEPKTIHGILLVILHPVSKNLSQLLRAAQGRVTLRVRQWGRAPRRLLCQAEPSSQRLNARVF
jgi:hypothetical protein